MESPITSAGTNSWALRTIGPIMLTINRSNGGAGSTSAPAPWATWPATPLISRAWRSSSSNPNRSRSSIRPVSLITKATPCGRSSAPVSVRGMAADPLTMTWFDGGEKFPSDKKSYKEHLQGLEVPESGLLLIGEKGSFFSKNDYGAEHILLPVDKFKDVEKPKPTLPRSPGHFTEWVNAIKSKEPSKAMSNFDYAGRLTETVLLGVVALKAGTTIEWDPVALKAKNLPSADQYIRRDYRKGFSIHS